MPHVVKLSDELVAAAKAAAALSHRSTASQIEFWATLGKSIDGTLTAHQAGELVRSVREPAGQYRTLQTPLPAALAQALREALSPEGRATLATELAASPNPRYGTSPALPGCLIRFNSDGTRTVGRWVNDDFEPLPEAQASAPRTRKARAR
jgi:hypothetical protein